MTLFHLELCFGSSCTRWEAREAGESIIIHHILGYRNQNITHANRNEREVGFKQDTTRTKQQAPQCLVKCSQCRSFLYSFLFFNKREKRLDSLYEAAAVGVVFMRSKMSIVLSKYFSGVTSWHTCIKTGSVTVPHPCCARPFKMAERGK